LLSLYLVPTDGADMPFDDPAILGAFSQVFSPGSPTQDEDPPAAPQGLTATAGSNEVLLGWSDNVEPDLDHYNIYQATAVDGPFTLVANSFVSDHTVISLVNGTTYWFFVVAVDDYGYESLESAIVSATPSVVAGGDVTPPAVPTWGTLTVGDRQIFLDWNPNVESDFANYKLYRSVSGGSFVHIATRTASDYVDTGLTNGTTYSYKVSAVDTTGNESAQSTEVSGSPVGSGADTNAPSPPTGLTATASDRAIVLNWNDSGEADLANYKVFRSFSGGAYVHIVTRVVSDYVDGALTNGIEYFYKLKAVDTSGNESGFSSIASAIPVAPVLPPPSGGDGFPTYADRVVTINPGDDIDTKITSVSAGTIIGFASGVHLIDTAGKQFSPRNGERLVGQTDANGVPLAILRGNWDQTQNGTGILSPFPFPNTGAYTSNVQFLRLMVERFACEFQQAAMNGGDNWRIHKCFIHDNKSVGVRLGDGALLYLSKIYHNGQLGLKNKTASTGATVDGCEVYENNYAEWNPAGGEAGGMKFIGQDPINMIVRNSHYHHNIGAGIWYDDAGAGGIIEDNLSEFNTRSGIFYEISTGQAFIRRNVSRYNGGAAEIYLANSRGTSGSPIIVEDNLAYNSATLGSGTHALIWIKDDPTRSPRTGYTTIRRNKLHRVLRSGFNNRSIGHFGSTTVPPGMTINDNDHYTNISNAWQWLDVSRTWSQWQAEGFDTIGSLQPYVAP
jgi:fibronectin type 3 domain-containing protein